MKKDANQLKKELAYLRFYRNKKVEYKMLGYSLLIIFSLFSVMLIFAFHNMALPILVSILFSATVLPVILSMIYAKTKANREKEIQKELKKYNIS